MGKVIRVGRPSIVVDGVSAEFAQAKVGESMEIRGSSGSIVLAGFAEGDRFFGSVIQAGRKIHDVLIRLGEMRRQVIRLIVGDNPPPELIFAPGDPKVAQASRERTREAQATARQNLVDTIRRSFPHTPLQEEWGHPGERLNLHWTRSGNLVIQRIGNGISGHS